MDSNIIGAILGTFTPLSAIIVALIQANSNLKSKMSDIKKLISSPLLNIDAEIDFPRGGHSVSRPQSIEVSGTISGLLPDNLELFLLNTNSNLQSYWPQGPSPLRPTSGKTNEMRWTGHSYINSAETTIVLVIAGDAGKELFRYYEKANNEVFKKVQQWPSIDGLPKDVKIIAKVSVTLIPD